MTYSTYFQVPLNRSDMNTFMSTARVKTGPRKTMKNKLNYI